MNEFYANLTNNIVVQGEDQFEKVFVKGHIYEFSPRVIYKYLNITIPENFTFEKTMCWMMLPLNCSGTSVFGLKPMSLG